MAASAPVPVCPYCKGVGVVVLPMLYATPLKTVHVARCGPCEARDAADETRSSPTGG